MPAPLKLELTAEQRLELEHVRDRHGLPYMRERAGALLKVADGMRVPDVAAHGLLKQRYDETVAEWVHRYTASGLAGLGIQPGRGRKPTFFPSAHDE